MVEKALGGDIVCPSQGLAVHGKRQILDFGSTSVSSANVSTITYLGHNAVYIHRLDAAGFQIPGKQAQGRVVVAIGHEDQAASPSKLFMVVRVNK